MKISKRDLNLLIILVGALVFIYLYFVLSKQFKADIAKVQDEINAIKPQHQLLDIYAPNYGIYLSQSEELKAEILDNILTYPPQILTQESILWLLDWEEKVGNDFNLFNIFPSEDSKTFSCVVPVTPDYTDEEAEKAKLPFQDYTFEDGTTQWLSADEGGNLTVVDDDFAGDGSKKALLFEISEEDYDSSWSISSPAVAWFHDVISIPEDKKIIFTVKNPGNSRIQLRVGIGQPLEDVKAKSFYFAVEAGQTRTVEIKDFDKKEDWASADGCDGIVVDQSRIQYIQFYTYDAQKTPASFLLDNLKIVDYDMPIDGSNKLKKDEVQINDQIVNVTSGSATLNVSGTCSYEQFKNSIDFIYNSRFKTALNSVSLSYNALEDNLSADFDITKFYINWPGAPSDTMEMPQVLEGVDNLFKDYERPVENDQTNN